MVRGSALVGSWGVSGPVRAGWVGLGRWGSLILVVGCRSGPVGEVTGLVERWLWLGSTGGGLSSCRRADVGRRLLRVDLAGFVPGSSVLVFRCPGCRFPELLLGLFGSAICAGGGMVGLGCRIVYRNVARTSLNIEDCLSSSIWPPWRDTNWGSRV
ncbi:hypothetical protein QQ045_015888 [Rhodiola kirilowii]